jgi:uncharacterized protein (TIGR02466 family)
MMAAPKLMAGAPEELRRFIDLPPSVGAVYLWESWLRHEVLVNRGRRPRVSISFNYA